MAQHVSENTALFLHLESNDLHTVKEFRALILDNLASASARDPSFLNALVEYYIQTNSTQAQDILAGIREPLDKPLLDKLNEYMKSSSSRLAALTLLGHIVRRQPSWLYKIIQAPLFASLILSLKTDTNTPLLMCGVLTVTTLLPMIPSQVGPVINDICEIFARLASWNVQKPGDVHDLYQLHLQAAVYALFHRLYGMYPWNFIEFLQTHYAHKEKEFNIAILPMLERVRFHPQLIIGKKAKETDLARWRKMEVHDILMDCARVSLDTTESTRDDRSNLDQSMSEYGRAVSMMHATRSNVSSACKTTSPASMMTGRTELEQYSTTDPTSESSISQRENTTANTMSQDILSTMWSPAVDCGLMTPPTSHPPSPGGSIMDISLTSSFQMGFGDPSSSLTTPRDSPHSALNEEQSQRLLNMSDSYTPSKAGSGKRQRGKIPGALPRPQQNLQRTTSAPSTPGYNWEPASPIRTNSTDRTTFNFGAARTATQNAARIAALGSNSASSRSRQSSGKESGLDDSVAEDSIQEEAEGGIHCPKGHQEDNGEDRETSVSLKDLPSVIRTISDTEPKSDDAINAEVISIVSSPQQETGVFMSKVIPGLQDTSSSGQYGLSSSTPKYEVDKSSRQLSRGAAEGADDTSLSSGKFPREGKVKDSEESGKGLGTGEAVLNASADDLKGSRHCLKAMKALNQKLFNAKPSGGSAIDTAEDALEAEEDVPAGDINQTSGLSKSSIIRQSSSCNQGFTPIKDQDHSMESMESPCMVSSAPQQVATSSQQAFMSFAHLYPYVMPHYSYPPTSQIPSSGITTPSSQQGKGDDVSISSESFGHSGSLHSIFSPNELLDRHISLGDDMHGKELSRIPLTSQMSVNWTHYGGVPPADEINLLKGQVQLLHNQLLYERHKREVHAGRNRRLLGKTHKAKAYEEQNSAMKDQLRLQEQEILRLSAEVKLLRQGNRQLSEECTYKDKEFQHAIKKLESEKLHLTECKEELNKLLVTHREEVDKINKDLKGTQAKLFEREEELASTRADIATNRHLKDEISRLNKEILLLGEANVKYKEKMDENRSGTARTEEEEKMKESTRRELTDCHDAIRQKNVQLEAVKSRIAELENLVTQKDRSIAEQKRYLENVKSLSKGKVEAIEAKYNSLKKVNQRQEAHILKLTKRISERDNSKSQRSNPDGAQSEDSNSMTRSGSSGTSRNRSGSPRKTFDHSGSSDERRSSDSRQSLGSDVNVRIEGLRRQTPLGDEGKEAKPVALRTSTGVHGAVPTPRRASQDVNKRTVPPLSGMSGSKAIEQSSMSSSIDGKSHGKDGSPLSERVKDGTPSPSLKLSAGSPFQRVQPTFSIGTPPSPAESSGATLRKGSATSQERSDHHSIGSTPKPDSPTMTAFHDPSGSLEGASSRDADRGLSYDRESLSTAAEESCEEQPTRVALVQNMGSGMSSQGIASLLDLDTSIEEPGPMQW